MALHGLLRANVPLRIYPHCLLDYCKF